MSTHSPIGVFDSGVGGLSVLGHIRRLLPAESLIYVADSAHAPYGGRPAAEVRERAERITAALVARGAKAVVVACNTATAVAVDALRRRFDLPIVAMEPALKPAAATTRSGVVGVLATAGTLGSDRYLALRDRHGERVRVLERACHRWVEQVERNALATPLTRELVARELAPLLEAGADVLVLGCTHFPFLAPLIRETAGAGVTLLDPGPAVAAQLGRRLVASGLARPDPAVTPGAVRILTTGGPAPLAALRLWNGAPPHVEVLRGV